MTADHSDRPCELDVPAGAPSTVDDGETVIRHIRFRDWIVRNDFGVPESGPGAFTKSELTGKEGRSVSLLRGITSADEIMRRGTALNRVDPWAADPVAARGSVAALRSLIDHRGRRKVCVNADPVTDALGFCPTHASLLVSRPPLDEKLLVDWHVLRQELRHMFGAVTHLSGAQLIEAPHPSTD